MLQLPVSGIFCLSGLLLFLAFPRRPMFNRVGFAASIAVTAGVAIFEYSGGSTLFDGRHWDSLLVFCCPGLVSAALLTTSLAFQRLPRAPLVEQARQ